MLLRSVRPISGDAPLVADPRNQPLGRRRRTRRRAVIGSIAVVALTVAAGAFAIAGLGSSQAATTPLLTAAPVPEGSPTPTGEGTDEGANGTTSVITDAVGGQAVWLAQPASDPVGVAYILPNVDDDPETLVQDPTAAALMADGWAVASGALMGRSWGSPASSQGMEQLRGWVDEKIGQLPVLYTGAGMGGTTAITSMSRQPALAVTCWYAVAPITDLVTLVGAQPALADEISTAWQRIPSADENPSLTAASLPQETKYRVVVPATPQFLVDDANTLLASLQESGHTVTTLTASRNATPTSLAEDLIAFSESCTA